MNIGDVTVEALEVGTRLLVAAVSAGDVRLTGLQYMSIAALAPVHDSVLWFCDMDLKSWPENSLPRYNLGMPSDHEVCLTAQSSAASLR